MKVDSTVWTSSMIRLRYDDLSNNNNLLAGQYPHIALLAHPVRLVHRLRTMHIYYGYHYLDFAEALLKVGRFLIGIICYQRYFKLPGSCPDKSR